ncbi:MAG: DNA primase [Kiritimatiellae bacterium]|nr:DNA primase [Kiritimatiellia bacterium]
MAGGVTESVVEEIKARVDIAELISSYGVEVRHAGSSLKACCPFHHEKTPSFNINQNKGLYHCFGCGESGDAIKFVEKMEGLSFPDAVKKLASMCGVKVEERADPEAARRKRLYALVAELAQFYRRCLLDMKEAAVAREYLEKRALDEKVCEDWLVGYAPAGTATVMKWAAKYGYSAAEMEAAGVVKPPSRPGDQGYHRFGGRLMFTIRDRQGRAVGFSGRQIVENRNSGKYVNSPETAIFRKSAVLFGFDRAARAISRAENREVICCEGQIDTIRLHVCGFTTAVASQGTAFTEEHARMIKRVADAAVLMYDDDSAGRKATIRVAGMLLAMEMPVRVAALPGGEDPDSFLRKHGPESLREIIDSAESIASFQCRVEREKERNPGSIDAVSRVSKAVLSTIAACPSAILRASLVDEAAKLLRLPAAALSEELSKAKPPLFGRAGTAPGYVEEESADASAGPAAEHGGAPAEQETPPGERELAFMEFLLANEYDATLDGMMGAFLPGCVFAHDFTRRFAETWRTETAEGTDKFGPFSESLTPVERGWFDRILLNAGKTGASGLGPAGIAQDFVRSLWVDALKRSRGALPSAGEGADEAKRMKLSYDIKRLPRLKWHDVKDLIKDYMMKGEPQT